jgi:hypothetical protein
MYAAKNMGIFTYRFYLRVENCSKRRDGGAQARNTTFQRHSNKRARKLSQMTRGTVFQGDIDARKLLAEFAVGRSNDGEQSFANAERRK